MCLTARQRLQIDKVIFQLIQPHYELNFTKAQFVSLSWRRALINKGRLNLISTTPDQRFEGHRSGL
jgi:hypothetical protein